MKQIIVLTILIMLHTSCDNNKEIKLPHYDSYFTFMEHETNVFIEDGDEFVVKARKTRADKSVTAQYVKVIENESTAIAGIHFTTPAKMSYLFPSNNTDEQSLAFNLIPENITGALVLVLGLDFDNYGFVDDGNHIDKIKIHIIPDSSEK